MTWTKHEIKAWLAQRASAPVQNPKDRDAIYRALQFMYDRQTDNEKAIKATVVTNKRGFTSAHAAKLSYEAKRAKARGFLFPDQAQVVARLLMTYAGTQLLELATVTQLERISRAN